MVDRSLLEERRERLRSDGGSAVNGIDYVEIDPAQKNQLHIYLVHPAPGETNEVPVGGTVLTAADIEIAGGDRVKGITVLDLVVTGAKLSLTLSEVGDFSVYIARITSPDFDRVLSEIAFGFHGDCPSDFDPCDTDDDKDVSVSKMQSHYLARDFDSYRLLMLDKMAISKPDWLDKEIPDLGITLVELMAYYADYMAYAQDVVATEAYLHTARMRTSLRRHAKLLGYDIFDGQSARLFVHLEVTAKKDIDPEKLQFATKSSQLDGNILNKGLVNPNILKNQKIQVFEPIKQFLSAGPSSTFKQLHVSPFHNRLEFHDWSDENAFLPAGSTTAWFRVGNPADITLTKGDFLLLEQLRDPSTRRIADADITKRQIVRLVEDPSPEIDHITGGAPVNLVKLVWHSGDALKFDLAIGTLDPLNLPDDGPEFLAVAAGNIVLTDHGLTHPDGEEIGRPLAFGNPEDKDDITSLSDLDYACSFRPALKNPNISIAEKIILSPELRSASSFGHINSAALMPSILIDDKDHLTPWKPVKSLIDATDDAQIFVPERETDGKTYIRFSNPGNPGLEPNPGATSLVARYRIGLGKSGNIGAESIGHVIHDNISGISEVRNPLSGFAGRDPETSDQIRLKAPRSIRDNKRAVTTDDYVRITESFQEVQAARVREVWHGSWTCLFIAVDLFDDFVYTEELVKNILARLEPYRLIGHDLVIEKPNFVPLNIVIHVCIQEGYLQPDVLRAVRAVLSSGILENGTRGFFHNDNLTFGEPVFSSQIFEKVLSVDGVVDLKFERFEKWRRPGSSGIEDGVITVNANEIPILKNDPNSPERGVLTVQAWTSQP